MEIVLGLLIIAIGSFGQSSCYVPINKIKKLELGILLDCAGSIIRVVGVAFLGCSAGRSFWTQSVRTVYFRQCL